jgi:hypothetical protein
MDQIISAHHPSEIDHQEMVRGGKQMIVKPVNLKLGSEELLRLVKIFLDEDKEDAILFLKEVLKPQVDQATREQ